MKRRFDPYSRTNQLIIDGAIFASSLATAYLVRFEGFPSWASSKQFYFWLPYLVAARLYVNWKQGIYWFIWRYVSLSDAIAIGRSLSLVTALLVVLRLFYPDWAPFAVRVRIPLSVIVLEYLLSLAGTLGARSLRRILYERGKYIIFSPGQSPKRALLYGAGRAGLLLLKELKTQGAVEVVGFIDDDPQKIGTIISGVKVLGSGQALEKIVRQNRVDKVVISIATASRKTLGQILRQCEEIPIPAEIIPTLQEIVQGRVTISQVREVRIEDLLGRESFGAAEVHPEVRESYRGKRILVTGAGGSIGSELVRQLVPFDPDSIAILDKDENSIYELEQELTFQFPDARFEPQIAELRQRERLLALLGEFRPQIVIHAAAHKHVPLMERHPCEAVLNNVYGTKVLLDCCCLHRVDKFVFISTDKAVNPTSVMGATKRAGEILVQAYASRGAVPSACVRFGNVMGSRGSVIPLFQKQIASGGPITVTDPEVARFFLTIPEAVQLVLCAGTLGGKGEIFVLDMGNPRKILDLAYEIVHLSGLEPGKDIEIAITGLRPGEKILEELVGTGESACPTQYEKLLMITSQPSDGRMVLENLDELIRASWDDDKKAVHEILSNMGLNFLGPGEQAGRPASAD